MSEVEHARAANRAAYPEISAVVDEFKRVFECEVKVLGGVEGGREFGVISNPSCGCEENEVRKVFCGKCMVRQENSFPIEFYKQHFMGVKEDERAAKTILR